MNFLKKLFRRKKNRRIPLTGDPNVDRLIREAVEGKARYMWDTDNKIYLRYNDDEAIYEQYLPPEIMCYQCVKKPIGIKIDADDEQTTECFNLFHAKHKGIIINHCRDYPKPCPDYEKRGD